MFNTGQYCCGTERVYVMDDVVEEFTAKVVDRVRRLRQSTSGVFDVGPMFWDRQLEKVTQQVDSAVSGARPPSSGANATSRCRGSTTSRRCSAASPTTWR
ncbi:MAG: aldehyde dehydrogenase family protein [Microthrixaceae bacterium]